MSDAAVQLRLETIFGVFRVSQKKRTLFRNDKPVLQWPDRGDLTVWQRTRMTGSNGRFASSTFLLSGLLLNTTKRSLK